MLPVVRGERETTRQIVLYTLVLVAFTLGVGFWLGPVYRSPRPLLGGVFLGARVAAPARADARARGVLFHYSLLYLALLFVAMAVESGAPVKELTPELERKNLVLGLALFGLFLLLFAGTVGVALLYLASLCDR